MTVKIWNSYSCNNSSSFRLVARFADPAKAEAAAAVLRDWFPVHAEEMDTREDYSEEPSQAQRTIGEKYGFTWGESLHWGDSELGGDEPEVFVREDVLIVQHTYCGGLGDLSSFVEALGAASTDESDERTVPVSLLFRVPSGDTAKLDGELTTLFSAFGERKDKWSEVKAPWAQHESYGNAAWFRDSGTVGIHLPVDPRDIAAMDRWLAGHGIAKPSVVIDEPGNQATFEAIAKARCTSCSGGLDYLDPRLHDIEAPQLVCKPCGGLYELSTFV